MPFRMSGTRMMKTVTAPPHEASVRRDHRVPGVFLTLAILWAGGGYWHWSTNVPMLPTTSVEWDKDRNVLGFLPGQVLAVSGISQSSKAPIGPIDFIDVTTSQSVRSLFSTADELVAIHDQKPADLPFAVLRRPGDCINIAAWDDGRILLHVPEQGWSDVRLSPDYRLCGITDAAGIRMFDIATGKELWNRPGMTLDGFSSPQTLTAWSIVGDRAADWPSQLDVYTGADFDPMHQSVEPKWQGVQPEKPGLPARRWFLVPATRPGGLVSVRDIRTREVKWTLPQTPTSRETGLTPPECHFSADGETVCFHYPVGRYASAVARYRAADGAAIAPLPDSAIVRVEFVPLMISDDETWSVISLVRPRLAIPWLDVFKPGFSFRRSRLMPWKTAENCCAVVDNRVDRIVAMVPTDGTFLALPDGRGFIRYAPSGFQYYSFPPHRNWLWLCLRVLLPVTILLLGAVAAIRAINQ